MEMAVIKRSMPRFLSILNQIWRFKDQQSPLKIYYREIRLFPFDSRDFLIMRTRIIRRNIRSYWRVPAALRRRWAPPWKDRSSMAVWTPPAMFLTDPMHRNCRATLSRACSPFAACNNENRCHTNRHSVEHTSKASSSHSRIEIYRVGSLSLGAALSIFVEDPFP